MDLFSFVPVEIVIVICALMVIVAVCGLAGGVFSSEGKASIVFGAVLSSGIIVFVSTLVQGGNKAKLVLIFIGIYLVSIWVGAWLKNFANSLTFLWSK